MGRIWFLESISADGARSVCDLEDLPFRVGRDAENDLVIATLGLSRRHAVLEPGDEGGLRVTDLGSTNGTFVNRERIAAPTSIAENDIIHFATAEFRLRLRAESDEQPQAYNDMRTMIVPSGNVLTEFFVPYENEFLALLNGDCISSVAQPIVNAHDNTLFAYELLGRATHPELPRSPERLFKLAATLGREVELSEAFRQYALAEIAPRTRGTPLFVNSHPAETFTERFFVSISTLRTQMPYLDLVVEVHETAVTDTVRMRTLATRLKEIGVRFAYDDFGAGQARLNEMGDVPAHFVKFDMGMIRGIDQASERKQRMVGELVRLVEGVGAIPLAEGVEMEAEARVCRELGFKLIQGYLTGKPLQVSELP